MTDPKELRKLAQEATQGQWGCDTQFREIVWAEAGEGVPRCYRAIASVDFDNDRAFIAAANPQTVIELLDRIAALEAALMPFAEEGRVFVPSNVFSAHEAKSTFSFKIEDLRQAAKAMEGR